MDASYLRTFEQRRHIKIPARGAGAGEPAENGSSSGRAGAAGAGGLITSPSALVREKTRISFNSS